MREIGLNKQCRCLLMRFYVSPMRVYRVFITCHQCALTILLLMIITRRQRAYDVKRKSAHYYHDILVIYICFKTFSGTSSVRTKRNERIIFVSACFFFLHLFATRSVQQYFMPFYHTQLFIILVRRGN